MRRALRLLLLACSLVLAACPGPEPTGPDAGSPPLDDAAQVLPADAATALPDGALPGPDAGNASGRDAGAAGADASGTTVDAGPVASPAVSYVTAGSDAVASYLMSGTAWNLFSGDHVPLGRHFDAAHVSYHTALRFSSVRVPAGATITSAKISWYPTNEVDSNNNLWLLTYAERVPNSAPFDPSNYLAGRPDQRLKTTAFIDKWLLKCMNPCDDSLFGASYCAQRRLDCWDRTVAFTCPKELKALVQEVVNLPGWAPGNAMTIFMINGATDQDGAAYQQSRSIVGFDATLGADKAPKLVIEWQ